MSRLRSVAIFNAHVGIHGRALLIMAACNLPSICRLPRGYSVSSPAVYQSFTPSVFCHAVGLRRRGSIATKNVLLCTM